ncbi:putative ABC transporter ATP-binding protein YknV [Geobacter sp. OR-1]|uniref:ABC transporter ATP-binding protein n=1 Tax=Geobacter sp. OR-1 TaxID=1266765 RepID=UPI00054330A0|nr:ABC transporter ATP-binding protein [Geobacter sp. OR-1]GAM08507.1 putative ABC transporter ATP-binding protein YknV [Geobacter sp. OR-1]
MRFGGIYEDEIVGKAYDRALMGRFLAYLRPYRWLVLVTLAILPLTTAAKLAQPLLIKLAIDNHIVTGQMAGVPKIAAGFLGLIMVESLLSFTEVWLLQYIGQRIMQDLRLELFVHVQRLSTSFYDRTPTGSLVTRLTSDVEVLGEMFAAGIITVVGDLLLLAGIVGVMLWMNLRLSLATFSVLPILLWVAFAFRRKMRAAFRQVRSRLAALNSSLNESIGGISVIQLFNRQKSEQEEFRRLNSSYRDANLPVITWDASLYAAVEALSSVAVGLLIWYGGGEIISGALTFGALVAFIQYIEKFFSPIRDLSAKYSVMQGAMAALERLFNLLDTSEYLPEPAAGETISPPHNFSAIEFRDVWFAYKGEEYVLKNFSLTISQGEKIALVGESGGGKTTVTRLLSRLYDVIKGSIAIDGIDLRRMPVAELRQRIGIVLQDPYLFTGSIEDNICLNDDTIRPRVAKAAAVVGADRFIERLPNGYREEVRERGVNFSAGERQLISFARAVAFDPQILVLDEATASVDTASERLIQEGLQRLMAGRTTLVVAHRLSTIRDADRIAVIHRGEKVEEGSHSELLASQGLYYRLHSLQFKS